MLFKQSPTAIAASEHLRVLVLHSHSQEYPWTKRQHQGFMSRLSANGNTDPVVETEYLDTKRQSYTPDYAVKFADYLAF